MAAPLKPHWGRPSHADIQEVIITSNEAEFTSKSLSKIALPPWGLFARLDFPPCTIASEPTYATVQFGRDMHLNLNSDLLYINHSCEPSLIFDTTRLVVIAGPKGLQPGDELTFFYPSTEWHMAQPFDCLCGKETCRGRISGARDMTAEQLQGVLLNKHIYELLDEQKAASEKGAQAEEDISVDQESLEQIAQELREATDRVEKAAAAANRALKALQRQSAAHGQINGAKKVANGVHAANGVNGPSKNGEVAGAMRRGPTSRELSGEMGGDTSVL
ncbi:hypothetical protein OQA88_12346 [Cercophora sp. LCS_1]